VKTIDDAFALAVDHQQNGRTDAAQGIYRLIIDVQPGHPAALNNLGLMLGPVDAVAMFRRALATEPNYVDALVNLSSALQASGAFDEASVAFERALRLIPEQPESLFRLGHVLQTQGRTADAAAQYKRAIRLQPDFAPALCNLGILHTEAEQQAEAAGYYTRALASDPTLAQANLNLVSILESEGRLAEAKPYRRRIARPQALVIEPAPDHRRTVLVLANTFVGNIPLDTIMPSRTTTRITWQMEFATPDQAENLPPYDVAFNAIGNADVMDESLDSVSAFSSRHRLLNSSHAVARTRRDRLHQLLDGIPGIVVPRVLRVARGDVGMGDLVSRLGDAGIECPVLVRPIVGHGGEGLQLVRTPQELAAFVPGAADAYYFAAYHDCRRDDGFYRKYRMIFVDRTPFAYHLAISDRWLVHYFSAAMLSAPWKRDEEHRFLADPSGVLGPLAMAALTTMGQRLDLDFAGIDFAVLPDGCLLVFEANATMLVHLRDSIADFPYKHLHVPKIFEAVDAMLDRHASLPRPLSSSP
jgi:Tfp pilus assembly protein PilF